jgi:hypothetical protein
MFFLLESGFVGVAFGFALGILGVEIAEGSGVTVQCI